MCGRYASSRSPEDLVEEFEVLDPRLEQAIPPSWNVAPTDPVYAVLERLAKDGSEEPVRQLRALRWGLVPSWAKDASIGSRMINARMETVAEKPAFRKAFAARRCILPADGYFEWYETQHSSTTAKGKTRRSAKQPFFITPGDGSVLGMAGLYEIWRDPAKPEDAEDRFRWTCTVLTTEATDDLGRIHDRMPLIVARERRHEWLDPRTPAGELPALLRPAQQTGLTAYPVGTAVGNVANNGPELVQPVPLEDAGPEDDDGQGTLL
ncbi:SOS response-associated peptidase [Pimelobacter simplex]|uniref:SOS response-associated peptidase n=1 Tax=Nocardioides simplex TaxID=2045 RepID=UPI003AB0D6D4